MQSSNCDLGLFFWWNIKSESNQSNHKLCTIIIIFILKLFKCGYPVAHLCVGVPLLMLYHRVLCVVRYPVAHVILESPVWLGTLLLMFNRRGDHLRQWLIMFLASVSLRLLNTNLTGLRFHLDQCKKIKISILCTHVHVHTWPPHYPENKF